MLTAFVKPVSDRVNSFRTPSALRVVGNAGRGWGSSRSEKAEIAEALSRRPKGLSLYTFARSVFSRANGVIGDLRRRLAAASPLVGESLCSSHTFSTMRACEGYYAGFSAMFREFHFIVTPTTLQLRRVAILITRAEVCQATLARKWTSK